MRWEVGDLAECIEDEFYDGENWELISDSPARRGVYLVIDIVPNEYEGQMVGYLRFPDWPGMIWTPEHFRKVPPKGQELDVRRIEELEIA